MPSKADRPPTTKPTSTPRLDKAEADIASLLALVDAQALNIAALAARLDKLEAAPRRPPAQRNPRNRAAYMAAYRLKRASSPDPMR